MRNSQYLYMKHQKQFNDKRYSVDNRVTMKDAGSTVMGISMNTVNTKPYE